MRTLAVQVHAHGGPEVLELQELPLLAPAAGEVQVRHDAIGVNFADIYQRQGRHGPHQARPFPFVPGAQGAGIVTAVGSGVADLEPGDRIAYLQPGAYMAIRNLAAARCVKLPAALSTELAGAWLVRMLTTEYLLRQIYRVQPGDRVLVHAAAGGMGLLLTQWARFLGATVIGTVGSELKAKLAQAAGCHVTINYRTEDFAARTLEVTEGRGVAVVFDSVGKDVFIPSLRCLQPRGLAINYGTASGHVNAFDLQLLHSRSLMVCRPTLRTFTETPADLQDGCRRAFAAHEQGAFRLERPSIYRLADVQQAHSDLESRATTGACILVP